MATEIATIENLEENKAYLPRTVLKAIADKNGEYLDEDLTASDINALKNGALTSLSGGQSITFTLASTYSSKFTVRNDNSREYGSLKVYNITLNSSVNETISGEVQLGEVDSSPFDVTGGVVIHGNTNEVIGSFAIYSNGAVWVRINQALINGHIYLFNCVGVNPS